MDEDTLVLKINNYFTLGKRIKYIDIITTLIDLVTVFFFYNDHFEYIDDNLSINKKSNIFWFVVFDFLTFCLHFNFLSVQNKK